MSNLHPRTCRQCGSIFDGGPRAWYCHICREDRRRKASRDGKRRERARENRPLGSKDSCAVCGKEYVVNSGKQKYCPTCAPEAVSKIDREQGLAYYHANSDTINPVRNAKRRRGPNRKGEVKAAMSVWKQIPWDDYIHLLGTMPDKKLAELVGCAENTVWKRRRASGISPFGGEKKTIPWDDIAPLIGKMPDTEIAALVGCSPSAISMYKAGTSRPAKRNTREHTLNEHLDLLGTMLDSDIAKICGCTSFLVARYRKQRGIESYTGLDRAKIPWEEFDHLLGVLDDHDVAKIINCSVSAVRTRKTIKKIPRKMRSQERHTRAKIEKIDWTQYDHLLGSMHDNALAQIIGCSNYAVQARRRSKGIKSIKRMVDWDNYNKFLGTISDSALARIIGVTPGAVRAKRKQSEQRKGIGNAETDTTTDD